MKEFNQKTTSLSTIKCKIEEFWADKKPNQLYSVNHLTNKLNLSKYWRQENYRSENIILLIERNIQKIEMEIIEFIMKSLDGAKLY